MRSHEIATTESSGVRGLIAVNVALLMVLGLVTFGGKAFAQRARGSYTMVSGAASGSPSEAVFVADITNQQLLAVVFNPGTNELSGVDATNMAVDARQANRGGNR